MFTFLLSLLLGFAPSHQFDARAPRAAEPRPVGGCTCLLRSDLNGDCVVDDLDIDVVEANWGTTGPAGDADGDGFVGLSDIAQIIEDWGLFCP